jgi:hypothetical protein
MASRARRVTAKIHLQSKLAFYLLTDEDKKKQRICRRPY